MASAFTHALIGGGIGLIGRWWLDSASSALAVSANRVLAKHRRLPWIAAICAVAPDLDVLMHAFVEYSDSWGHRGAFHSAAMSALVGLAVALCYTKWSRCEERGAVLRVAVVIAGAHVSHGMLDMATDGGLGVALLWPLSDARLFWPVRPLPVSPLQASRFFGPAGLRILARELPFAIPFFFACWVGAGRASIAERWWKDWFRHSPATERSRRKTARKPPSSPGPPDLGRGVPKTRIDEVPSGPSPSEISPSEPQIPEDGVVVMEITDSIDLHHFAPRDILSVVDAYLEAAAERGFRQVRLIHGRGRGVQRARVQQLLRGHPLVHAYRDAPQQRGGLGATLAWLVQPNASRSTNERES